MLTVDSGNYLECPLCHDIYVHLDDVFISGRPREDGPFEDVTVNKKGSVIKPHALDWMNKGGRRHSFGLGGYCEGCGANFVIEFQQHKGSTIVSVKQQVFQSIV